uniref:DH domain-containing protein n=1 Tax=Elaeophora elaphi TaxID=1147741 RepID=A0A0R3S5H1_9BILA
MTDHSMTEVRSITNEESVEAGDQTMTKIASKSVRGKSETVRITDESFEDDAAEVGERAVNKINDDMVKKLLMCDKNGQKSNEKKAEGNVSKTPEQLEEMEMLREIAKRPLESFKNMKDVPDAIAKTYYKDITRRWKESEARIKETEDLLSNVKYDDRSLEEDRLEILGELLDKATQSFEIFEEHENRKVPYGHRIVLEVRLLMVFNNAVNLIYKIIGEFDKLKGDQIGVNDERDQLRYEIRYCDAVYTEVHERFLKSYLEMEW